MRDDVVGPLIFAFLTFVGGCTTGHMVTLSVSRHSAVEAGVGEWRIDKHGDRSFHWAGKWAPGTRGPVETPKEAE